GAGVERALEPDAAPAGELYPAPVGARRIGRGGVDAAGDGHLAVVRAQDHLVRGDLLSRGERDVLRAQPDVARSRKAASLELAVEIGECGDARRVQRERSARKAARRASAQLAGDRGLATRGQLDAARVAAAIGAGRIEHGPGGDLER